MALRTVLVVAAIMATGALGVGCSSDCESVCDDQMDCPGVSGEVSTLNCGDACNFYEDRADSMGCTDEYDAYFGCEAEVDDVCTSTDCAAESQAFFGCMSNNDN